MKKYLPALVCGFAAGVLNIVPIVKSLSCCMIIPVAAFISLVLNQKATGSKLHIKPGMAVFFGLMTGMIAAFFSSFFDVLIIYITRSSELTSALPELEKMMSNFYPSSLSTDIMNVMYKMSDDISKYGFSTIYTVSVFMSSLIVDSIFGIVGGLISMQILNKRNEADKNGSGY
ncbi:MAG: hypothetical protein ACM3S2_18505 [Ignavibacteriales bacterium]